MGESVRLTREQALDAAVAEIGGALRARYHLAADELLVEWHCGPDGHAELRVGAIGAGQGAIHEDDFDDTLTALRDLHIDVLDAERWAATVGERQYLAEMPSDAFAARMRSKVK
jgi:hypothetical protein